MTGDALDLLTLAEVAELLRIPQGTLRYWRSIDAGPESFRMGSHVRYTREAVTKWVAEQKDATARGGAA